MLFMAKTVKCVKRQRRRRKKKKLFQNFCSLVSRHDLLQTLYVDSPSLGAFQQQIWLNLGKSYIDVKIMFFVFLSIHSQCGMTASWAARYTTVNDLINSWLNIFIVSVYYMFLHRIIWLLI